LAQAFSFAVGLRKLVPLFSAHCLLPAPSANAATVAMFLPAKYMSHGSLLWCLLACHLGYCYQHAATDFVIVSQPRLGAVVYTVVDALNHRAKVGETRSLVSRGLREPYGIALDKRRERLFVADAKHRKVFMYHFTYMDNALYTDERQHVVVQGMTPRWVTVDDRGTLFCSDEARNRIVEVSAEDLEHAAQIASTRTLAAPRVLYSADSVSVIDRPGGVVAAGDRIFWANKERGRLIGSVLGAPAESSRHVRGAKYSSDASVRTAMAVLGHDVDKVYGICATQNTIFYTGASTYVYAARRDGPEKTARISDALEVPRGCAWDGDGTIFVADKGGNAVWVLPSSLHRLGIVKASKVFEVEDPYGVAVFRPPPESATSYAAETFGFLLSGGGKRSTLRQKGSRWQSGIPACGQTILCLALAAAVASATT